MKLNSSSMNEMNDGSSCKTAKVREDEKKITSSLNALLIKIDCYSSSQQQRRTSMDVWPKQSGSGIWKRNAVLDSDLCPEQGQKMRL
ncbi:hypothetical protein T4C_3636 [Trichinella pseudospiralis]|uniref:Uncharacterized protein n=1 Tax=Trichinella pseudospiralis TaxID=6337 RepID=A0A0V1K4H7_TRIPS|nr:hypothetical protein T4C_3636 [Trichinella pseudospiralis]